MFQWFWQSALVDRITPEAIDVPNIINMVQTDEMPMNWQPTGCT
jgi:hypothetical protein